MTHETIYPQEVETYIEGIYESLLDDGFYFNEDIVEFAHEATRKIAGPMILEEWLTGEIDLDNNNWFDKMLKLIIVHGRMMSLEKKGLIGSIDDEHGEEVFFATTKGKELIKNLEKL